MSATAQAIPSRGRVTLAETAADSRVMATRQLRKVLRRPMYVVYLFVQPVIFVLLFRYVFGGAIKAPHTSYVNYLLPGNHRDDGDLRGADDRARAHRGPEGRGRRPLPVAADRAVGGPDRTHRGRLDSERGHA